MGIEVELKFLADGEAPLDSLAAAETLGAARLGPGATFEETDVYLDTAAGHLAAAGWACRHRDRGRGPIVSLKGPVQGGGGAGGIHARPELEGPATSSFDPRDWAPSDARDRVLDLCEGSPLVERLRLRQRRTERAVEIGARAFGTLSLDAVTVVDAAGGVRGRFAAVELELVEAGSPATAASQSALSELGAALSARPGLAPDTRSKLEHAISMLGPGRRT